MLNLLKKIGIIKKPQAEKKKNDVQYLLSVNDKKLEKLAAIRNKTVSELLLDFLFIGKYLTEKVDAGTKIRLKKNDGSVVDVNLEDWAVQERYL